MKNTKQKKTTLLRPLAIVLGSLFFLATLLWGSDFHLRRNPLGKRKKIYALLEKAFVETDPDLTIITGDLQFSFNGKQMLKEFALFMEDHQRYWAYAFGNHDGQYRPWGYAL